MYKPISFNVIRQALAWGENPEPLKIRVLSSFKWPNGDTSAEYVLTFDGAQVRACTDYGALFENSAADSMMRFRVQESFCKDITLTRTWVDAAHDLWHCEIYCRISGNPHGWEQATLPTF